MPEAPEVAVVTRWLRPRLEGSHIVFVTAISGRYHRLRHFTTFLSGWPRRVTTVSSIGKFIYFLFDDNTALTCTLGMTGMWTPSPGKHARVLIISDKEGLQRSTFFHDIRNFGTLKLVTGEQLSKKINSLGIPVIANQSITQEMVVERKQSFKDQTLAEFLMDQRIFAGIGNYLKAEILFEARLSPWRYSYSLTADESFNLADAIGSRVFESYALNGASIKNYKTPDGDRGTFGDKMRVYGKKTVVVNGNEHTVIKEKTKDGRTTHWVPGLQV